MRDRLLRVFFIIRQMRNRHLFLLDGLLIVTTPTLALLLRTESLQAVAEIAPPLAFFTAVMALVKAFIFERAGLYTQYWPYASDSELTILLKAMLFASTAECLLFYSILLPSQVLHPGFPRSLPLIDAALTALMVGGVRLGIRLLFVFSPACPGTAIRKPVLIAGAGIAGLLVAKELRRDKNTRLAPIGFVDDDPGKIGKMISGLPVLGSLQALPRILKVRNVAEVIIAMPSVPGQVVRNVVQACDSCKVGSRTVPAILEIVRGTAKVHEFRKIQLEDLLRRGAIRVDEQRAAALLRHACVMVTGAGGSIGSEICRQIKDLGPSTIVLVGHGENSIFSIAQELKKHPYAGQEIHAVIADIRDTDRMEQVIAEYTPTTIFHAAAHKHVGLMQENYADAILNNVFGTMNVIDVASRYDVRHFVMISSDKAVNPTSIMGVTKRIAELIVHQAAIQTHRRYVIVRFGNVLGSRGSVVPIFQRQIETGGPITVSDPEVRRFFMTIPEAVHLVLQASTMGKGGEVFVLDMGEQIKVADLARDMLKLQGLKEGRDIEIKFTGLLPGEKLSEELFYDDEVTARTAHEKILMCSSATPPALVDSNNEQGAMLLSQVRALVAAAQLGEKDLAMTLMKDIVPQFAPSSERAYEAPAAHQFAMAQGPNFAPH